MIFYFTLFLETPNLHSYVVHGALVMVGGGKCMIQQCLDLYPSVEAHHKQWEELLRAGIGYLAVRMVLKDAPERGACSVSVNLLCFLTHHSPPKFRYVLDLFLMELSWDLVDYPLCHPYD